jgi:signal transduction histidine kinase/integral membrane sensor domain MASE1
MSATSFVSPWKFRALQVVSTFVAFAALNRLSYHFQIESGVSVFYLPTAVDVVACMHYGIWGAIGIFLGALATPWQPGEAFWQTATSGLLNVAEGMIPYLVFRYWRGLHVDLRDMRSFTVFLLFGTVVNSAVSALLGNLVLVPREGEALLNLRALFMWWVSDFSAALMLGVPLLAFTGRFFERIKQTRAPATKTTLATALKITIVIIILGWSASTVIQNALAESIENTRSERQALLARASILISDARKNAEDARLGSHSHPIESGELDHYAWHHQQYVRELEALAPAISADLARRVGEIELAGLDWFASDGGRAGLENNPTIQELLFGVRVELELAGANLWADYTAKNTKIRLVSFLMDQILLLVLILASINLVRRVSRPLERLHDAVEQMESEVPFNTESIDTAFVEIDGLATAIHDTSEKLRDREERLRRETARALAASKAKTEFLAKMSHELRTPLNSIIGFSDLLLEQYDVVPEDKRRRFLENVDRSGRHLLRLINDMLDIARVEAGKMEFVFEAVDLHALVARVVATTSPLFAKKRQHVSIEMSKENLVARGDAGRLDQVVLNLLSNANKFSPEDSRIVVAGYRDGDSCVIEIRDEGIGIAKADRERVFEEFEQASPLGPSTEGAGLGLALVRRLVEAHGGAITLESEPGKGSAFFVRLPTMERADVARSS